MDHTSPVVSTSASVSAIAIASATESATMTHQSFDPKCELTKRQGQVVSLIWFIY